MNRFLRSVLVVVCIAPLSASVAIAQDAPAGAPPAQGQRPRGPRPKPTNLKVLPTTLSGDDVVKIMRGFEGDLGVECEFCHARNETTKRNDFPSDANPRKETARAMIRMTDDLNTKYLAQLTKRETKDPITCGTCHRGMSHPEVFVPKTRERSNRPPEPASANTTAPVTPN
jgi:hypothetical protein